MQRVVTLGEVVAGGNLIMATCLDCWRQRVLEPQPLAARLGAGADLGRVAARLRCACGSRRCHAAVRLGEMGMPGAPKRRRPDAP